MSDIEESMEKASLEKLSTSIDDFTTRTTNTRLRYFAIFAVLMLVIPIIVIYHPFSYHQQTDELTNTNSEFNTVPIASYCDRITTRTLPKELAYDLQEGNVDFPATGNPMAKKYFNQGLTLFYGFNGEEAVLYFRKAAEVDVTMTMAHWGMALAVGSNINVGSDELCREYAKERINHAMGNLDHLTKLEKDLIQAHAKRYDSQTGFGIKYRDAMEQVYKEHSDNADVAAIYIDSIVDLFPFAFWHPDGKSTNQKETDILEDVLTNALKLHPKHIGLNHFNIHVREGSSRPDLAMSSAELFENMTVRLGHIVHMPAHVHTRMGNYQKAIDANLRAIAVDEPNTRKCLKNIADEECDPIYAAYYNTHNLQFNAVNYALLGQATKAIATAQEIERVASYFFDKGQPRMERYMSTYILTLERFKRWDEILKVFRPNPETMLGPMSLTLYHFAKAKAYLALGEMPRAQEQHQMFHHALEAINPKVSAAWGLINGHNVSLLASLELEGSFAVAEGRFREAVGAFRNAVNLQDQLPYDEPIVWMPIRPKLGAALFHVNETKEALKYFVQDLRGFEGSDPLVIDQRMNPNNVYSAFGEYMCLKKLGEPHEEAQLRYEALWNATEGIKKFEAVSELIL